LCKDEFEGAIAEYRNAIQIDPSNSAAHVGLGLALAKKGDSEGAIAELRKALQLNRADKDTQRWLDMLARDRR
jgi:Flp pilus assembly protein TadD